MNHNRIEFKNSYWYEKNKRIFINGDSCGSIYLDPNSKKILYSTNGGISGRLVNSINFLFDE